MRKRLGITVTTFCLILFFTLPASPAVYTWKDKDGNTVVSSSLPPAEVDSQKGEKESAQAGEDSPTGKQQEPTLRSKGRTPPRNGEGAQPGQKKRSADSRGAVPPLATRFSTRPRMVT